MKSEHKKLISLTEGDKYSIFRVLSISLARDAEATHFTSHFVLTSFS